MIEAVRTTNGYRELYSSGQEVEVKRATHDGYVWVPARVSSDDGEAVRCVLPLSTRDFHPDSVRKPGEDKR